MIGAAHGSEPFNGINALNAAMLGLMGINANRETFRDEDNALMFTHEENIYHNIDMTGSTDMGDLSEIMPVIQPTMGGFSGALHSKEFAITDKEAVYISASKILACTAYDLLKDGAKKAIDIINKFDINVL